MEKKSSEEAFEELTVEQVFSQKMEAPDTSLEESFAFYEEGIRLLKGCTEKLDRVEKQMIVLRGGMEDGNE